MARRLLCSSILIALLFVSRLHAAEGPPAEAGSFRAACWHAYGLLEDGRWLGPSRPWPTVGVGEYRVRAYSREEVLDSIRQCARELRLTTINSTDYFRWLAAKRRNARLQGREIRLAGQTAIYRHFPVSSGGWNAAVRAAMEDGGR